MTRSTRSALLALSWTRNLGSRRGLLEREDLEDLMKKAMICVFGLAMLATPAFAAFGDEYWVVQDSSTKRCSVIRVTKPGFFGWPFAVKPTGLTVIKTAFETRTEAENSMKTTKICGSG